MLLFKQVYKKNGIDTMVTVDRINMKANMDEIISQSFQRDQEIDSDTIRKYI